MSEPLAIVRRLGPDEVLVVFRVNGSDALFKMDLGTARGLVLAISGVITSKFDEAQVTPDTGPRRLLARG